MISIQKGEARHSLAALAAKKMIRVLRKSIAESTAEARRDSELLRITTTTFAPSKTTLMIKLTLMAI